MRLLWYHRGGQEVNGMSKKRKKNRRKLELAAIVLLIILKVLQIAYELLKD